MDKENMGYKIILSLSVILSFLIVNSAMAFSIAAEFRVNQFTDFLPEEGAEDPAIATDGNNHFIITWEDHRYGEDNVFARIFDNNGNPLCDEFRVDQAPDVASDPSIAVDKNDHFFITWEETSLTQKHKQKKNFFRVFFV